MCISKPADLLRAARFSTRARIAADTSPVTTPPSLSIFIIFLCSNEFLQTQVASNLAMRTRAQTPDEPAVFHCIFRPARNEGRNFGPFVSELGLQFVD